MDKKDIKTKKIGFRKYWFSFVFLRAVREIWEYGKAHLAMAALLILAALVTSILSTNGILDAAISNGYISDVNNSIRVLAALLFLSILYLLFSIFYYPVVIHREQEVAKKELETQKAKLSRKLGEISKTKPNILTPKFGVEVTPLSQVKQNSYGIREYVGPGDTVERFYIEFQNKKKPKISTEDADEVYVVVTYFDAENKLKIFDKPRWHGAYDVFDERTWYPTINLKASGNREQLYLAIRKQNDEMLYILGQESRKHESFISPDLELKEKIHYIRIELSAPNLDVIDYWIKMENKGREKPIFALLKSRPIGLKIEKDDSTQ